MHSDGFDAMNTDNSSDMNFGHFGDNAESSEQLARQAYEEPMDRITSNDSAESSMGIIDRNNQVIMQYAERLAEHFSNRLFELPAEIQAEFIASLEGMNGPLPSALTRRHEAQSNMA